MQIYLRSSLVVIGQLVEVFIVPFFILMSNVHRENMQTQKNIINSWKWRAVKHSNKSPLFCFKLGSLTEGLAKNIRDDHLSIMLKSCILVKKNSFQGYLFIYLIHHLSMLIQWFTCINQLQEITGPNAVSHSPYYRLTLHIKPTGMPKRASRFFKSHIIKSKVWSQFFGLLKIYEELVKVFIACKLA